MNYLFGRLKSRLLKYQLKILSKGMKFNFYLNPKEYITSQILAYGLHEKYLLEFIFSILPKKYKQGVCIDVGANIGNHSLFFSEYYSEIHAFEPVLSTFKALELNVLINNLTSKISTHNFAVSSTSSELRFFEDQSGDIGRSKIVDREELKPKQTNEYYIQSIKGDDYFFDCTDITMIKIDAEGHESDVIKGLSKVILLNHPIILFEANAVNNDSKALITLKKLGYKYFYSPQIKFYKLRFSFLKYFLRALFNSKFILIEIDENFNYFSQLTIASFQKIK